MKHSEAVRHVRALAIGTQRARSIIRESSGDMSEEMLAGLNPWLFGKGCILLALNKVIDRVDDGGEMTPNEFFNFVTIATRLEPSLSIVVATAGDVDFPFEADVKWVAGWEAES